jgi:tetratricopeptide (TPR) repeat protein
VSVWARSLVVWLALAVALPAQTARAAFERGVEAYRRGAWIEAEAAWREVLACELAAAERARVAYDLGNAVQRAGRPGEAAGWFTLVTRLAPRDTDAWANLEHARAQAGFESAERGDLRATLQRLLTLLDARERRWLALAGLVGLALVLALEAWFGGRRLRVLALAAALLALGALAPWLRGSLVGSGESLLVIASGAVELVSEPRAGATSIGSLPGGSEVQRIDRLPGWVRVSTRAGQRGWLAQDAVFSLALAGPHGEP